MIFLNHNTSYKGLIRTYLIISMPQEKGKDHFWQKKFATQLMKKKKINSWLPKLTCQISLPTIQKTRPNLQRAILLKKTPTSLALNLHLNDITFQTLYFLKTQNTGGNYFFIFIKNKNQVNFFKLIVQIICKKVSSTQFSSISTQF